MASQSDMQARALIQSDVMLEYHLRYNHYPPLPLGLKSWCRAAIEAVNAGESERVLEVEENGEMGKLLHEGREVTAGELVENLHLEGFLG